MMIGALAMTLLSACADNNLGTDTERESVIPEQNQKEDTNLYENELMEKTTLELERYMTQELDRRE